ncbi:cytochrome ubiquinol oxidase subunit I [Paenibacillus sp. TRM 82003]|nr:cytochrome ubiquinol oxidase subunit I [Paenibacillus sp. TRM 82003]
MDSVTMARALFGSSMAFHIIFATLGVGIPVMIVFAEIMYHIKKDRDYALLARRWTKGFAIILGVAIPSGTIVGVMISLLWPGYMEIVQQVIALPFQVEIFAFFLESLFMAIYVYAADRLTPFLRILSVTLVAFGASASAVLITDAHAWMNTPRGFRIDEAGRVVDVDMWAAIFNPAIFITAQHVLASAYMTGAFAIVSVAAYKLLRRGKSDRELAYHRKALLLGLLFGGVMSLTTAYNGHGTAQYLHEYMPEKLAAAEGLFETQSYAPLAIGGYVDPVTQEVVGGLEIPWALSFLAGDSFDTVVRGLNDFPRENWPPLYIHTLFNLMVFIGTLLIALALGTLFWRFVLKKPYPKWLLTVLIAAFPLSMLGIETGWVFSCSGRQPWVIYNVMRTEDAALQAESMGFLLFLFLAIYVVLLFMTIVVMHIFFRRHPVQKDLDTFVVVGSNGEGSNGEGLKGGMS